MDSYVWSVWLAQYHLKFGLIRQNKFRANSDSNLRCRLRWLGHPVDAESESLILRAELRARRRWRCIKRTLRFYFFQIFSLCSCQTIELYFPSSYICDFFFVLFMLLCFNKSPKWSELNGRIKFKHIFSGYGLYIPALNLLGLERIKKLLKNFRF